MQPTSRINVDAYDVLVTETAEGLMATVRALPGCVAVGRDVTELTTRVQQEIVLYLDDHPDAPRYYQQFPRHRVDVQRDTPRDLGP